MNSENDYTPEMLAALAAPDFQIDTSKIPEKVGVPSEPSGPQPIFVVSANITREHTIAWVAEHRRRKQIDPEYAAECEREKAESDAEWEERIRSERAAAAELEQRTRLESSGIPERKRQYLADYAETRALQAALSLDGCNGKTVLLIGGAPGVGKTVAACIAAWRTPGSVRFVTAVDLVRHGAFDPEFWDDLSACAALVVDDLGSEPLDERGWALASILDLLSKRYDSQQKTWITLNLPIEKFFARYGRDGERLRDRLRECGRYVEVKGPSMRGGSSDAQT
jgi:DNA replication protein DnaC